MRQSRDRTRTLCWIALMGSLFLVIQAASNLRYHEDYSGSPTERKEKYEEATTWKKERGMGGNSRISETTSIEVSGIDVGSRRKMQMEEGDETGEEDLGEEDEVIDDEGDGDEVEEEEVMDDIVNEGSEGDDELDTDTTKEGSFDDNTQTALEERHHIPPEERDVLGDSILLPLPSDNIFEQEPAEESNYTMITIAYEEMPSHHHQGRWR